VNHILIFSGRKDKKEENILFRLNRECRTKKGEILVPYLVEGAFAYCYGRSGKTVVKELKDFDFGPEKNENMVIVTPMIEGTDELFDKDSSKIIVPVPLLNEEKPQKVEKKEADKGLISNEDYI
jgi:hypothetical protein